VVVLLGLGVATAIGGAIWALVAKASADNAARSSSSMPTLPVHEFTQYTQHLVVPDYAGLAIGVLVAVIGVVILSAGLVVAFAKPRLA
jgi:hypothetical protein